MDEKAVTPLLEKLAQKCAGSTPDGAPGAPCTLPWTEAAGRGDYQTALSLVENELNEHPASPGAKLWWVRCQLELNRIPITALSAPLEEIIPMIRQKPELADLAAFTFLKTAAALLERAQSRLAVAMLERALEFCSLSESLSEKEELDLVQFYRTALEDESTKAQQRRESRKYIEALNEKLLRLKDNPRKTKLNNRMQPSQAPLPRPEVISAKTIITEAARADEPAFVLAAHEQDVELSTSRLEQTGTAVGADSPAPLPATRSYRPALFFFAGISALALAVLLVLTLPLIRNLLAPAGPRALLAMETMVLPSAMMELPGLADTANNGGLVNAALDDVGKRLQQLSVSKTNENKDQKQEPIVPGAPSEIDEKALTSPSAKALSTSPQEDELEPIGKLPPARNDIPANRVPKPNASQFANTKVEEVGSSPRKAALPPGLAGSSLKTGRDGRLYGPPQVNDPAAHAADGKALDGSPLRSFEVQQFNPPLRYRTITATDVLSAPSLLASTYARLEADIPVDVTARMGQWLELRSQKGQVGYIYAQDAEQSASAR
ncbi:MAG TPA: hypothetical protein PLP17_06300 [Oligoflexia bacterium]|nr:hypothetical protein [Oligoflexia bacterium]